MNSTALLRSFHASRPLFDENPSTEANATETPAKEEVPKTVEEQLAEVKKMLEDSKKEVGCSIGER